MENMIAELWFGNIDPREEKGHNAAQLRQATVLAERNCERLSQQLNAEQKELLVRYSESYLAVLSQACEDAFVKGFSLGMRLTVQGLGGV